VWGIRAMYESLLIGEERTTLPFAMRLSQTPLMLKINIQLFQTFESPLSRQIWVSPRLTELAALSSRSKCVDVPFDSDSGG